MQKSAIHTSSGKQMAHSKEIIRMPNLISRERVTQESGKNVIQPVLRPQFVDVVCIFSVRSLQDIL
jgi:hypothetical protein